MSAAETALPWLAILGMAAATWLVRMAGYWIMGRVPLTPFMRACLDALPGTIIVATVVPLAARGGLSAWFGLAVAAAGMILLKRDMAALAAGLGAVIAVRAFGLP